MLERWDGQCAVTGVSTPEVLRASHIKSWADSNDSERLDPENGLMLTANLDALFDRGLISFTDEGEVIIKASISPEERRALGLDGVQLRFAPSERTRQNLSHHRARFRLE